MARRGDFAAVLSWIEQHLDQQLTVEQIARHAGLSPYHFSRLFTAQTGSSVMAYVRHLRLLEAARRITSDPDLALMDVALDSGFESQEAFTRSFQRTFGTSPGRLQSAYRVPGCEGTIDPVEDRVCVEQLPALARREAFRVTGLSHRYDRGTQLAIPGLWRRLATLIAPHNLGPGTGYGVMCSQEDGGFLYKAAIPLNEVTAKVPGMEQRTLPANTYAVFRMTLCAGPVHPQVKAAMQQVWGQLLPASGLQVVDAPDFEEYGPGFVPGEAGTVIDHHVPVQV